MTNLEVVNAYLKLKHQAPELLKEFRGARSYAKVAAELDCSRTFVYKIEKGLEEMPDSMLLHILERSK